VFVDEANAKKSAGEVVGREFQLEHRDGDLE
jgi:hypothetical protein